MKDISIIIATYNASSTLEKCLNSILSQKDDNVELLVIDGNSNDNSLDIIDKYRSDIDYFVTEPDNGIYDAWNKGISNASGKWIMFVGADDELLDDAIRKYRKYLFSISDIDSYDYICATNYYVDDKGSILKCIGKEPSWEKMKCYMSAAHVGSLHNKENLFADVGLYDLSFSICADYELLLRKRDHLRYLFVPDTIAKMKAGGMSMSIKALLETYQIRKKHGTINPIFNCCLLIKSFILYKLYKYHK